MAQRVPITLAILFAAAAAGDARAEQSDDCAAFFGDSGAHKAHAEKRESNLRFIDTEGHYIVIAHSGDWVEPYPVTLEGLSLVDAPEPGGRAVVELARPILGCPPGQYEISVDDALGDGTTVLAVLDGVVLLEHAGDLVYIHDEDHLGAPAWSLVWVSPWPINPYRAQASTTRLVKQPTRRR